ncbi:7631_t:CDS:1 [Funneliformis geosporum]|uniref:16875_t:CDS:1 n=1 Tax=Funneliformis geosporum TaxID=1117311 RepID=A0A9W4SA08_9GLOM|nr:16875_t:CDS:1 [Funneliformis geosporum]CAI2161695.1 7631_t:CDS:1 [Funneliformis geosporum]
MESLICAPQQTTLNGGDSDESCEDQSNFSIPSQPSKKKRGKISQNACNKCKRDKKKCDGNYAILSSCTYCLDHNEKCTYPEPGRRRPRINTDLIDNQSRGEYIENTLVNLTRFFANLSNLNQVSNMLKDHLFQLFVHPLTTIEQFLLLRRLWNEMNDNPNDNRFGVENLQVLLLVLTILIQNREESVQQHFWEHIRQIVDNVRADVQSMTPPCTSSLAIQPSIFPHDIPEQPFSVTQPGSSDVLPPDYLQINYNAVQYDNNQGNFQHPSTNQLDKFFTPLVDNVKYIDDDPISLSHSDQNPSNQQDQETSKLTQPSQIQIIQESEPKLKKQKTGSPTKNREKKGKASRIESNKQRKCSQASYLNHVHIMHRPVKPESKTSLVFHKEDPIDNTIITPNLFENRRPENQYTPTIPQYQHQDMLHLSYEHWNIDGRNNGLFINQQTSQQTTPQQSLSRKREQSPQNENPLPLFNHLNPPEQLSYFMNPTVNNVSEDHNHQSDFNLILGMSGHLEQ